MPVDPAVGAFHIFGIFEKSFVCNAQPRPLCGIVLIPAALRKPLQKLRVQHRINGFFGVAVALFSALLIILGVDVSNQSWARPEPPTLVFEIKQATKHHVHLAIDPSVQSAWIDCP